MVPKAVPAEVYYEGLVFIRGLGLDDIVRPGDSIVFLDEEYADMYGDYVFLGYNVYASSLGRGYADMVGLNTVLAVVEPFLRDGEGRAVIVCGDDPTSCTILYAVVLALREHKGLMEALGEAFCRLKGIYGGVDSVAIPLELYEAAEAYLRLRRTYGDNSVKLVFSLASAYNYGLGERFYSELVAWLAGLGASREALGAGLLSFLAESSYGPPREILGSRVEAVGVDALREALGDWALRSLEALEMYAEHRLEGPAAEYAYVRVLGPGEGYFTLAKAYSGKGVYLYCSRGEGGVPAKECLVKVSRAVEVARQAGLHSWREPRIVLRSQAENPRLDCWNM